MDPLEKIILTAILVGVISLLISANTVGVGFWIIMKNFSLLGSNPLSPWDKAGLALCAAILAACVLACPVLAYCLRDSVLSLGLSTPAQIVIFTFIACAHVILLIPAYYTVPPIYKYAKFKLDRRKERKIAAFLSLVDQVKKAGPRVTILRSRILADDGIVIRAEFTLAIKNVPLVIPGYAVRVIGTGQIEKFHVPYNVPRGAGFKASTERNVPIIAANENDRWVFYNHVRKTILSITPAQVTFETNIERTPEAGSDVPKYLSISLGAWRQQFRRYPTGRQFFIQTFPIVFE